MEQLFTLIIYQPFLNILVFFYWLLGEIGMKPDMGVAVILMTIVLRVVMIPLSIASDRSEHEREEIGLKAREIQEKYSSDPVRMNYELKLIMRTKPRILIAEMVELFINIVIFFLLLRLFSRGLEGADLHLLYPVFPHPPTPYNLVFLGRFDLTHPNVFLNLLQSFVILLVEVAAEYTSPFRNILSLQKKTEVVSVNPITRTGTRYAYETRSRIRSLQFFLPIVSFLIFMFLPAGKKLFIVTTLLFSLLLMLLKAIRRYFIQAFPAPAIEPEPIPTSPEAPSSSHS